VTGAGKQTKPRLGYSTEFSIVVRWESGLPLRLARRTATSADEIPDRYVVSVGAVPLAFLGAYAGRKPGEELSKTETAAFLAASTFIQRGEKGAIIRAEKAEWLTSDFSPRVNISFPRGQNPIELRDADVVVAGHIDTIGFKARFALKPMVYRGKLELWPERAWQEVSSCLAEGGVRSWAGQHDRDPQPWLGVLCSNGAVVEGDGALSDR